MKKYFKEDMDLAIKANKNKLTAIYNRFSRKKVMPGCKKFMCI